MQGNEEEPAGKPGSSPAPVGGAAATPPTDEGKRAVDDEGDEA